MNSVERMLEYSAYQPEAPAIVEGHRPLPGWPQQARTRRGGTARLRGRAGGLGPCSACGARPPAASRRATDGVPRLPRASPLLRRMSASMAESYTPWPSCCRRHPAAVQGAIEVRDLVVRYRPDLDPVLKGLTFSVRGREKVRAGLH